MESLINNGGIQMAGKGKRFNQDARDSLAASLAVLPEKPKVKEFTAAELVRSLKSEIKAAQAKGYTLEEIIEHFKSKNVDVGISTLKTETRATKRTKGKSDTAPASAGQPEGGSNGN